MRSYPFGNFKYGIINKIPVNKTPDGSAYDSLNWLTLKGRIELARGYTPLGTEIAAAGRVTGLKTGIRADGLNVAFKTYGKKVAYYNDTVGDWTEIGLDLLGSGVVNSAGVAEDISLDFFEPVAGKQMWINSPHAGPFKIMIVNPGDAISMYDASYNYKGYIRIYDNQAYLFNIDAFDLTTVRTSYIEVRGRADYTQVVAESVTNGAALSVKAGHPKASFLDISGTGGAETFTEDLNGKLVGSAGGTGTINYATGVISFIPVAGAVASISVTYRWIDETTTWTPSGGALSGGIANFAITILPRVSGQPNVFQQAHGGNVKAIASLQQHKFIGHERAIWDILPSLDDTKTTNTIFRENIGIKSLRGMFSTPEGIYTVNLNDLSNPEFVLVQYSARTTDIKPLVLSQNLDLSSYSFDELAVFPFNDYMCFSVMTSDAPHNNRLFLFHRNYKTWDILDYPISTADIFDDNLIGGDPLSNNVYTFFSGNDFNGETPNNFWKSGITNLGYLSPAGRIRKIPGQKKVKRILLEGDIGPDQILHLYASVDRGAFVEVLDNEGEPVIKGSGSYVDKSQQVTIGSVTLGNKVIGGGSNPTNGIEAYHYERYIDFVKTIGKFAEVQFIISASELGYASVTKFDANDIRILQNKPAKKYRVF